MFNQTIIAAEELPIPDKKRVSTDVCCTVLAALIALTIFIAACVLFNKGNLNNAYFNGTDSTGQACNIISYSDFNDPKTGSCVTTCPNDYNNNNGVCWPSDSALAAKYNSNPNLTAFGDYVGFKNSLVWTSLLALSLGILWFIFVTFFPKLATHAVVYLAVLILLIIGILTLSTHSSFFDNNNGLKIFVAILSFVLAIIIACMGFIYSHQLRLQGIFLQYARRFLHEVPSTLLYIPIFIIFTFGLFALFIFQHCAFSSSSHSNNNFFDFSNPGFWGVLNVLELIWGLRFLRDAFIYCVSGNAFEWYWYPAGSIGSSNHHWYSSLVRLVTKNWGSVVGGSFVNAFFEIPTFVIELFVCHPGTCCSKLGNFCSKDCSWIGFIFDLVRTDSYAYTHITGMPFCNSARQCAKICSGNPSFVGNQNPIRSYRFITHVFLIALTSLFGYIFANIRVTNISWWYVASIITVSYAVVTWFVEIYGAAAEGISTSFLTEHFMTKNYETMQRAIPVIILLFSNIEIKLSSAMVGLMSSMTATFEW